MTAGAGSSQAYDEIGPAEGPAEVALDLETAASWAI
jgi:hypothetical protein